MSQSTIIQPPLVDDDEIDDEEEADPKDNLTKLGL